MPIFAEKFLLPIMAFLVTGVILMNPWKWDWRQRASLFAGVMCIAYFISYTLDRNKQAGVSTVPTVINSTTGPASANGPGATANTGNNADVRSETSSSPEKKKDQ